MGDFGYIFGYALFIALAVGVIIGHMAGYYQRKNEEPQHIRMLVDKWKKRTSIWTLSQGYMPWL